MSDRTFVDKAWTVQHKIEKKFARIGNGKYARVLRMARKPDAQEFKQTANVVLIGIAVIGGIGFAVFLLMDWLLRLMGAK